MTEVSKEARELLAAEYEKLGYPIIAKAIREKDSVALDLPFVLRAVDKALASSSAVRDALGGCRSFLKGFEANSVPGSHQAESAADLVASIDRALIGSTE